MNLSGRLNAFATVVAGPIEVTGAAVVAADVVAATVRASATIVARAVVILVVPVLIRIRSITTTSIMSGSKKASNWGPQNNFPAKRLAERGRRMNQSYQRARV